MEQELYQQSIEQVLGQCGTDPESGLSSDEVAERQQRDGYNEFTKKKHTTLWQKFISSSRVL